MISILDKKISKEEFHWVRKTELIVNKSKMDYRLDSPYFNFKKKGSNFLHKYLIQNSKSDDNAKFLISLVAICALFQKNQINQKISIGSIFNNGESESYLAFTLDFEKCNDFVGMAKEIQRQFNEAQEFSGANWKNVIEQCKKSERSLSNNSFDLAFCYNTNSSLKEYAVLSIQSISDDKLTEFGLDWINPTDFVFSGELFVDKMELFFQHYTDIIANSSFEINLTGIWSINQHDFLKKDITVSDKIRQKIESIWKKSLNIDQLEGKADFFDIGGASIKAVEVISLVNDHFMINLDIETLFVHSELDDFCLVVRQLIEEDAASISQVNSMRKTILILSDDSGGIPFKNEYYKRLSEQFNCHFIPIEYDSIGPNNTTIEVISANILERAKEKGILTENLIVFGYSAGALLATELKRQAGINFSLFLIDPPKLKQGSKETEFNFEDESSFIQELFLTLNQTFDNGSSDTIEDLWNEAVNQLKVVFPDGKNLLKAFEYIPLYQDINQSSIDELCRSFNLIRTVNNSVTNYSNRKISNPDSITFFYSKEGISDIDEWRFNEINIKTVELNGDHSELLSKDNFEIILDELIKQTI